MSHHWGRGASILVALALSGLSPRGDGFRGVSEAFPTGSTTISSAGLVASYDMSTRTDDGSLRDFSGRGHHARFLGAPRFVASRFGEAMELAATSDRLQLTEHPDFDLDGPLTIAARVRVEELGLHQHIVACDDKWALWVTPDNRYRLGDTHGGGWSTLPDSVPKGAFRSVVAVLRGSKGVPLTEESVSLYLNGERAEAEKHLRTDEARERGRWNPGELFASDACYIGFESHQGNPAHRDLPFMGAIDELLIFSRAWSDEEVIAFSDP